MTAKNQHRVSHITVGQFYANHAEFLGLRLEGLSLGMNRAIREPTINRPGLALAGFYSYFPSRRIQVIGNSELSYLRSLKTSIQVERCKQLFSRKVPCLVVARDANIPPHLLQQAAEYETPIFRTPIITMKFINAATIALELEFSPTASEYGSMVDVQGIGVLIRGASGVGKSECVLGLIERGYSLVSDDITKIKVIENRELVGMSAELTRFHMEVRGIGIINVASIFGVGSVRPEKRLDLVVTLIDWHEVDDVDRLGIDRDYYEILGIRVPHVTVPVKTGRDLGRLVEVAAMDQKLKSMGHNTALEFNQRLLSMMQQNPER